MRNTIFSLFEGRVISIIKKICFNCYICYLPRPEAGRHFANHAGSQTIEKTTVFASLAPKIIVKTMVFANLAPKIIVKIGRAHV